MSATERIFEPRLVFMAILAIAVSQYAVFVLALFGMSSEFTFGGDFAAFWAAARETLTGEMLGLYAPGGLEQAIQSHSPHQDLEGLTWQYPPHASLLFSPIGLLPFHLAYLVWCLLGLAVYAGALFSIGLRHRLWIAALASIPVLIAVNTGQNALFTGALLLIAVYHARSRPLLAGLAAALLTIKPQLGFLLPVLFLAGGYWRAFLSASIASLVLVALSVGIAGLEAWLVFFESIRSITSSVSSGLMPVFKMVNVNAAATLLGMPSLVVMSLTGAVLIAALLAVIWAARWTNDRNLHYAVIACLTLFAAPYSFYYELVLLVPAVIFIAQRGYQFGWLRFERETIAALVLLSLTVPGLPIRSGVSVSFLLMALAVFVILRRVRVETQTMTRPAEPQALAPAGLP
jgi:alpha-1,2-mannosyltransferase